MPIRAALFDIGNVLVTFDHSRANEKILPRSQSTPEGLRAAFMRQIPALETGALGSAGFLANVCEEIAFAGTPRELQAAYEDIFEMNWPIWEVVRRLAPLMPICLFSNTSQIHEEYLFLRYPDFQLFPQAVMSWRVGFMKPGRRIYEIAQEQLGCTAEEILYIDDLPDNVATGQAFGFQTHAYDWRRHGDLEVWLEGCNI